MIHPLDEISHPLLERVAVEILGESFQKPLPEVGDGSFDLTQASNRDLRAQGSQLAIQQPFQRLTQRPVEALAKLRLRQRTDDVIRPQQVGTYGLTDPPRNAVDLFRDGALREEPCAPQAHGAVGVEEHPDRHGVR